MNDEPVQGRPATLGQMDPTIDAIIMAKAVGRHRCSCGNKYSREIVILACEARGHRPLTHEEVVNGD